MTTYEAKTMIAKEFIEGFTQWLKDEKEMPESDYGRKYGWGKAKQLHDDSYKSFTVYVDNMFGGRYIQGWNKAGYESQVIYDLHKEGFLSYKSYCNSWALAHKQTDWYYVNRKTAKAIHNQYKEAKH